jgi:hypothetical protein
MKLVSAQMEHLKKVEAQLGRVGDQLERQLGRIGDQLERLVGVMERAEGWEWSMRREGRLSEEERWRHRSDWRRADQLEGLLLIIE